MNYGKILRGLEKKVPESKFRRFSLAEIISESYKSLYDSAEGTNLQRLAESHLADVRRNPGEIERLSRQLCVLKHVSRMVESKEMDDSELLVPEEYHDTVEPKEKKLKESVSSINGMMDAIDAAYSLFHDKEAKDFEALLTKWGASDVDDSDLGYFDGMSDSSIEGLYYDVKKLLIAKIKSMSPVEVNQRFFSYGNAGRDLLDQFDLKLDQKGNLIESQHDEEVSEEDDADLLEDTNLTDEEVDELSKHLSEIRKNKKKVTESSEKFVYNVDFDDGMSVPFDDEKKAIDYAQKKGANSVAKTPVRRTPDGKEDMDGDNEEIIWTPDKMKESRGSKLRRKYAVKESKSWGDISLKEFSEKSAGKAFVKTFKKLDGKLHEGTALTRQESISLYKAANSAMTHLSVELEHNPGFLPVFRESVSLLSVDVSKLLESMKNGKAPSKATMKSLAKFSEALLLEDEEEELPPIEDEEDTSVESEDSGEEAVGDSEEFDQEYADVRVGIHQELADKYADNPEVQDKLKQDAEEILNLPGITDEKAEEIAQEIADSETEDSESGEGDEELEDSLGLAAGALGAAAGLGAGAIGAGVAKTAIQNPPSLNASADVKKGKKLDDGIGGALIGGALGAAAGTGIAGKVIGGAAGALAGSHVQNKLSEDEEEEKKDQEEDIDEIAPAVAAAAGAVLSNLKDVRVKGPLGVDIGASFKEGEDPDNEEEELELEDSSEITDEELAELKKHLTEMRKAKKASK